MSLADLPVHDPLARHATPTPVKGTAARQRARDRRRQAKLRAQLRVCLFDLDGRRCRCCLRRVFLRPSEAPRETLIANVHEFVPRSLGGDPLAPENTIVLCHSCHAEVTAHRLTLIPADPVALMRGVVAFVPGVSAVPCPQCGGRETRESHALHGGLWCPGCAHRWVP